MGITLPWPGAVPGPPEHPTLAVTLWVPVSPSLQFNDLERAFSEFLVRLSSGNTNSRKCVQYTTYILIKSTLHQKKKISVTIQKYTNVRTSLYGANNSGGCPGNSVTQWEGPGLGGGWLGGAFFSSAPAYAYRCWACIITESIQIRRGVFKVPWELCWS